MSDFSEISSDFKKYVTQFHRAFKEQQTKPLVGYYDSWNKHHEKYKILADVPNVEKIAVLVDNDEIFLFLYRELYYRHIYSHFAAQLTTEQRFASWENYSNFFEFLLGQKKPVPLELPPQWIWDIIDEFLYQYQEFCQFRLKPDKPASEIQKLKDAPKVWNTLSVLKFLYRFISVSDIPKTLERERSGLSPDPSQAFSCSLSYSFFGYFSIIGLCRMHCILGDYFLALKTLDPIELFTKKSAFAKITPAYISLYYYCGFAFMMVRRYQDSIKTFTYILLHISRMKQYHTRQYDQKKNEQMYALLAILLHFCPRRIDEHITNILKTEHSDKLLTMPSRENEDTRGADNFSYGCPKFVSPSIPNYDEDIPTASHATPIQKKLFMKEINQCTSLPVIGSYLKLYTTIHTNNLANLLDQKHDKDTLRMYLLRFVHKNYQLQWSTGTPPIKGTLANASDVDFYIDGEMIHVIDTKVSKNYADAFIRHCTILEEIRHDLEKQSNKNY